MPESPTFHKAVLTMFEVGSTVSKPSAPLAPVIENVSAPKANGPRPVVEKLTTIGVAATLDANVDKRATSANVLVLFRIASVLPVRRVQLAE